MKQANKQVEKMVAQAYDTAVKAIEQEARRIMRKHKRCASFCMGMGHAGFYDKAGEPIGDWGPLPYPKYLKDFDSQVNEWDCVLHMTGHPMRIAGADAPTLKDW